MDNINLLPIFLGVFLLVVVAGFVWAYVDWRLRNQTSPSLVSTPGASAKVVYQNLKAPDKTEAVVLSGIIPIQTLIFELRKKYSVDPYSITAVESARTHNLTVREKGRVIGVLSVDTYPAGAQYKGVPPEAEVADEVTVTIGIEVCDTDCQIGLLAFLKLVLGVHKLSRVALPRSYGRMFAFTKRGIGWDAVPYNIKVPEVSLAEASLYYPVDSITVEQQLYEGSGPEALETIRWAVHAQKNVLVTGPTGSGKTTLVNIALNHPEFAIFMLHSSMIPLLTSAEGPAIADAMRSRSEGMKRVIVIDEAAGVMATHKDMLLTMMDGPLHQVLDASIILIACKADSTPDNTDLFRVGRMSVEIQMGAMRNGSEVVQYVMQQFPDMVLVGSTSAPSTIAEVNARLAPKGKQPPQLRPKAETVG